MTLADLLLKMETYNTCPSADGKMPRYPHAAH